MRRSEVSKFRGGVGKNRGRGAVKGRGKDVFVGLHVNGSRTNR